MEKETERRSDVVQVGLTPRERGEVEAIAREQARSLSDVGRDAILALLRERSDGAS